MNRIKMTVLVLSLSTCMLTGCAEIKEKIPFLAEDNITEEEAAALAEQQTLIGTYTEDGLSIIVGFDENGWPITEPVDVSVATQNNLGITPDELLSNTKNYDSAAIITRNDEGTVLSAVHYQVDYDGRKAKKDWYNINGIGTTYYDNYTNKAYTNIGMVGWEEVNNERLTAIMFPISSQYFTLTEYTSDNLYAYVAGELDMQAVGEGTVLMQEIYNQLPTLTGMRLLNIYDIATKDLFRAEITVICPQGEYTVTVAPEDTSYFITIPDYVTNPVVEGEETPVMQGIVNTPLRAYLYSALYSTDDPTTITRDWLITEYEFRSSELERDYGVTDVEAFLQQIQDIDDDMAVDEFLNAYAEKAGVYETPEENAVYSIIYDRLQERDATLSQDIFDAMVLKPEPEEITEEGEEGAEGEEGIEGEEGTEGEEGSEESTEEETESEEPTYTVMYCNGTTVNKRSGPGTQYDKAGQHVLNDEVWVVRQSEEDPEWSECIDQDGNTYYIKSSFLREQQ